jgi:hypothetical protein
MVRTSLILLLVLVAACKLISFENPQPEGEKALTTLPKRLQGKYLAVGDDGSQSKDTVIIDAHGYHFGYFDPAERAAANGDYEAGVLSDTLVVKSYKGYYFFNSRKDSEWLLRVVKQEKNGDLKFLALEEKKDTDFKDFVNKLSLEIRIDSFQVDNTTLYRIDPTPKELITLLKKGYFTEATLVRVK